VKNWHWCGAVGCIVWLDAGGSYLSETFSRVRGAENDGKGNLLLFFDHYPPSVVVMV